MNEVDRSDYTLPLRLVPVLLIGSAVVLGSVLGTAVYYAVTGRTGTSLGLPWWMVTVFVAVVIGRQLPVITDYLLSKPGKHKMGKACLYFKRLADLDRSALERTPNRLTRPRGSRLSGGPLGRFK